MAFIIKPLVTEKMSTIMAKQNKYAGKNKSRYTKAGLLKGRTNAFKKAVVTIKEGETIDFYSNI